jgi:hypothetical protein
MAGTGPAMTGIKCAVAKGASRAIYETKKEKLLSYFRIIGYDREIAVKAETLMSEPFRPQGLAP